MVVPGVAADGDAVVARETLVVPGLDEVFAAQTHEFLEVDRARAELLLLGEVDIGSDVDHLQIMVTKAARHIIPDRDDLAGRSYLFIFVVTRSFAAQAH